MRTNASRHFFWGTLLIWLGVLIWVPFIALQVTGKHPSFLWYLPFHLAGVVGGARLRASARKEMGLPPPQRSPLRIAGSVLIVLGVLAWAPYLYLRTFSRASVDVMDFLPFHLIGVLAGTLVLAINYISNRKDRRQ